MEFLERIEWNPRVCNGKPVIKGTRLPLGIILEQIAQGSAWDQLLRDYPELKKEDIQAALFLVPIRYYFAYNWATNQAHEKRIVPTDHTD